MRVAGYVSALGLALSLALIGMWTGCGSSTMQAQAAAASQVQVVNTAAQPVPVTGNVNATVIGTPTVNLGNTATVNVGNTPTVNVATMPAVTVVSNMDDPGRIPYQSIQTTPQACPAVTTLQCWMFPAVPANHRLVIQHISGVLEYSAAPNPLEILVLDSGSHAMNAFTPFFSMAANPLVFANFDQQVLIYMDSGKSYMIEALVGGSAVLSTTFAPMIVTGYMLDCAAAPCAAIAQ